MRKLLHITIYLIFMNQAPGQQIATWSGFHETGFIWNPALTARLTQWEFSGTHRQEWLGFEDAPVYSTASFQIPFFPSKGYGSSAAGVFVEKDAVGPFENYTLALSYAYKFKIGLQNVKKNENVHDELSLGFSVKAARYQFTPERLTFFNAQEANFASNLSASYTRIAPNISFGIYYSSRYWKSKINRSHYYIGLAANQLAPVKAVEIPLGDRPETLDIRLQTHMAFNAGYRYVPKPKRSNPTYFLESNILALYAFSKSMNAMLSSRFEMENKWWLSAGVVTNGEFFVQTGVIFDNNSILKWLVKDGVLRIGVKGDFHAGALKSYHRTGYEMYMAYIFEVDTK